MPIPTDRRALHELLGSFGPKVYFDPPETAKITYPCIIYELQDYNTIYADGRPYRVTSEYQVTSVTKDPDDPVRAALLDQPQFRFERHYVSDNLHHNVFIHSRSYNGSN